MAPPLHCPRSRPQSRLHFHIERVNNMINIRELDFAYESGDFRLCLADLSIAFATAQRALENELEQCA